MKTISDSLGRKLDAALRSVPDRLPMRVDVRTRCSSRIHGDYCWNRCSPLQPIPDVPTFHRCVSGNVPAANVIMPYPGLHHSYIYRLTWLLVILCVCSTHAFASTRGLRTGDNHDPTTRIFTTGFNCAKGHSQNEKMICSDAELAKIDYELSLLYAQAKLATHNSATFKKTNNEEWLWREQNCHDRACLIEWYAHRRMQLEALLSTPRTASISSSSALSESFESSASSETEVVGTNETNELKQQQTRAQPAQAISQQLTTLPLMEKPVTWIAVIGIIVLLSLGWELLGSDKETRKRTRMIARAVNSNINEFLERNSQAVHSGETHDIKKWDREKRIFIDTMVKPALTDSQPLSISEIDQLCLLIDFVAWGVKNHNSQFKFHGVLDGSDHSSYTQFCMRVLKHHKWKVRKLRSSEGDDYLVATRKTAGAVILCKLQSVPVGLEALREAGNLQSKHQMRKAVVVSNAPFTTSAENEADRKDALLLHHFSLSLLAPMVEL